MKIDAFAGTLKTVLPGIELKNDVPFSEVTTLGVGGKIALLAVVASTDELQTTLALAKRKHIPVFVLGGGSNLVGSDEPLDMLFVKLKDGAFGEGDVGQDGLLRVPASMRLLQLARRAAALERGGVAHLAGIPGTLGGALRMNASTAAGAIGELVAELEGVDFSGRPWHAAGDEIAWEYRDSSIPQDVVITFATLKLPRMAGSDALEAIEREVARRRAVEPKARSAGCAFRNVSSLESAGMLIDRCGLKGFGFGDCEVAEEHANYLVCRAPGGAPAADFVMLMSRVRGVVAEKSRFYLRPEVKFVNPADLEFVLKSAPAPKVAVLCGGTSSEREVSLRSGAAVFAALSNAGFETELIDIHQCAVTAEMRECDVVYPVLHGGFGEDGRLQQCMEDAGLRFVGSESQPCCLMMDKIASKRFADAVKLPTARWAVVDREHRDIPEGLDFPLVLKVPGEGSSVGVVKVDDASAWAGALEEEFKLGDEILVEAFIPGVEITVPVVNGEVLPIVEIRSPHGFYTYDAKYIYQDGHTEYFCPAQSLSPETAKLAGEYALKFYRASGCRDILRVDFIVDGSGVPQLLEGNTLPGSTATSLVPKSAGVAGMSFEKLTSTLVYAAMDRAVPAAPPAASRSLIAVCRAALWLTVALCALPMLAIGLTGICRNGGISSLWLILSGAMFLISLPLSQWLCRLEKNK